LGGMQRLICRCTLGVRNGALRVVRRVRVALKNDQYLNWVLGVQNDVLPVYCKTRRGLLRTKKTNGKLNFQNTGEAALA